MTFALISTIYVRRLEVRVATTILVGVEIWDRCKKKKLAKKPAFPFAISAYLRFGITKP